jgi:hypothetical protein
MSELIAIDRSTLTGIADAIREKTDSTDMIATTDMAEKILNISGGGFNGIVIAPILDTELEINQIDAQMLSMLSAMSTMMLDESEEE